MPKSKSKSCKHHRFIGRARLDEPRIPNSDGDGYDFVFTHIECVDCHKVFEVQMSTKDSVVFLEA
jgi:hypothetical protein